MSRSIPYNDAAEHRTNERSKSPGDERLCRHEAAAGLRGARAGACLPGAVAAQACALKEMARNNGGAEAYEA